MQPKLRREQLALESYVKLYRDLGLQITPVPEGKHSVTDCPFCDMEDTLFVRSSGAAWNDAMWDCKACKAKGNPITFIRQFYAMCLKRTTPERLDELCEDRGLPLHLIEHFGIAYNHIKEEYLLPQEKPNGEIFSVTRYKVRGRPYALSNMAKYPFGLSHIPKDPQALFVVEGYWDLISLYHILSRLTVGGDGEVRVKTRSSKSPSLTTAYGIIGIPGCTTWDIKWVPDNLDKNVPIYLCLDNDHPKEDHEGNLFSESWKAVERISRSLVTADHNVYALRWGGDVEPWNLELDKGYDIRDLRADSNGKAKTAYIRMMALMVQASSYLPQTAATKHAGSVLEAKSAPVIEAIPCDDFSLLIKQYNKDHIRVHKGFRKALISALATITMTTVDGNQLWIRIIGPPSSGKTIVAEAVAICKRYVMSLSTFTGFHSGYVSPLEEHKGKDSSLIPDLMDRTLVIKDADTLINGDGYDRIAAELRDLYDGASRSRYRNQKKAEYEHVRTSMIFCGTNQIRQLNKAHLGERFLDCCILADEDDNLRDTIAKSAITSTLRQIVNTNKHDDPTEKRVCDAFRMTAGYVEHLRDNVVPNLMEETLDIPADFDDTIHALAEFVACLRIGPSTDDGESEKELAARLCTQFTKYALGVALVLQKDTIDEEVYALTTSIAYDTAIGHALKIVRLLYEKPGVGISHVDLTDNPEIGVSRTTIDRIASKMETYGLTYTSWGEKKRKLMNLTPTFLKQCEVVNKLYPLTSVAQTDFKRFPRGPRRKGRRR